MLNLELCRLYLHLLDLLLLVAMCTKATAWKPHHNARAVKKCQKAWRLRFCSESQNKRSRSHAEKPATVSSADVRTSGTTAGCFQDKRPNFARTKRIIPTK